MGKSGHRRIGILGGTFDPIHQGHLALARTALAQLELDEVLFVVAARPPHKPGQQLSPFAQRLAMVELAIGPEPQFVASAVEGDRSGPSYSVDTLDELRHRLGEAVTFFFLIGLDAFIELASWHEFQRLPELAELVVVHRPGTELSVATAVKDVFGQDASLAEEGRWQVAQQGWIREMVMEPLAISSTEIREGRGATQLPVAVAAYIVEQGLYRGR